MDFNIGDKVTWHGATPIIATVIGLKKDINGNEICTIELEIGSIIDVPCNQLVPFPKE